MSNRFKNQDAEENTNEDQETHLASDELKYNFIQQFLKDGSLNVQNVTSALPFVLFLVFIGMLYITNIHMAENKIRAIEKLDKEVKELSWEYKTSKADLMYKSKLTEVAHKVDTLGLKELTEPPKKIAVKANEY